MEWLTESVNDGGAVRKTKIHMYALNGAGNEYIAEWLTDDDHKALDKITQTEYFPVKPKTGNTLWFRFEEGGLSISDDVMRGVVYKSIFSKMLTSRDSNTGMRYTVLEATTAAFNKLIVTIGSRSFTVSADSEAGKSLQLYAKEKIDVVNPKFSKFLTSELQGAWHMMNLYKGVKYKPQFTVVK